MGLTLEQARAIAVDLSPAKRNERTGLPRVAGGAGAWILSVPPILRATNGSLFGSPGTAAKSMALFEGSDFQLLRGQGDSVDVPRVMTEWVLFNLRIPAAVEFNWEPQAEAKNVVIIATVTLSLRVGGDTVWTQTIEQRLPGPETIAAKVLTLYRATFLFGADLVNPVVLPQGRTLSIKLDGQVNHATSTTALEGEIAGQTSLVATPTGTETKQGTISYAVRELSGHRTL